MPSLKEVRTRISSVKNTQQITSAMKLVAASKLKRAQDAILQMRPYSVKLNQILRNIIASLGDDDINSVYGEQREPNKVLLVMLSSNRGLCGSFNANIIKKVQSHIDHNYRNQFDEGNVSLLTIGKKADEFFRRRNFSIVENHDTLWDQLNFDNVLNLAENVMNLFVQKEYDRIDIIYNQFKNAASQIIQAEQFLPIQEPEVKENEEDFHLEYIFEPSKLEIVTELIPMTLKNQFYKTLLDSIASEHGARMTAMHQATDNASELLRDLKLEYNKARQATITNEILEIVSGAEALKG